MRSPKLVARHPTLLRVDAARWNELLALCPHHRGQEPDASVGEAVLRWTRDGSASGRGARPARTRDALALIFSGVTLQLADLLDRTSETELQALQLQHRARMRVRTARSPEEVARALARHGWSPSRASGEDALIGMRSLCSDGHGSWRLPQSAYGAGWDQTLLEARKVMSVLIDSQLKSPCEALTGDYLPFLKHLTFSKDAGLALHEGADSILQATSLLTAHRVPGCDAPGLVDQVVASRLPERLAKGPIGVVAPLVASGLVPVRSLVRSPEGGWALSPEFFRIVEEARQARLQNPAPNVHATARGCPVAVSGVPVRAADGSVTPLAGTALQRLDGSMARLLRVLHVANRELDGGWLT